jgi:hypothetical protein
MMKVGLAINRSFLQPCRFFGHHGWIPPYNIADLAIREQSIPTFATPTRNAVARAIRGGETKEKSSENREENN